MSGIDTEHIRGLLEPALAAGGFEVVDVLMSAATLQVLVDLAEAGPAADGVRRGIDLDGVAAATRLVDAALESADPISQRYTLEVSSPGLERPLRRPTHFRRFLGATVSVKTVAGTPGERRVEGLLEIADPEADGAIVVAGRRIAYSEIERARSVFTWGAQPKPGKGAKSAKGAQRGRGTGNDIDTADDLAAAMGDRLGLDADEVDQLADLREDRHHGSPGSELLSAELDDLREWEGLEEGEALDLDDLDDDEDDDFDDADDDEDGDLDDLDDLDGFDRFEEVADLERLDGGPSSARVPSVHVASSTNTAEAVNPKGDKR